MTIKIIPATIKPLAKTPSEWRSSQQTPSMSCNGLPQESCASDSDINAIDNMLNGLEPVETACPRNHKADKITVTRGAGLSAPIAITPEKAAEMMVANYCKQNGGVIVDNKKVNQVILG